MHNKFYIISSCHLLNQNHFDSIGIKEDSTIIHMNFGVHRNKFNHNPKNHHLVVSTKEHAKNGEITIPYTGDVWNYKNLPKVKHLYESIKFLFYDVICKNKLDPWYGLYENYDGEKEIWGYPDLNFWKDYNKRQILPSSGFRTLYYLKTNYPSAEVNLVGFIGHHILPSGKKYGIGHNFDFEQKWIHNNIHKENLYFGSLDEIDNLTK